MLASKLPIKVDLDSDAGYYASHSFGDVRRLAERIDGMNDAELKQFIPAIFTVGLMYPSWWFQKVLQFVKWKQKIDDLDVWRLLLNQPKGAALLKDMQRQTVDHILAGKDREERRSIGGWSQREINYASNLIAIFDRCKLNKVVA